MSPIVSILMANYNGAAFVADALVSVARQTLSDFEVLFVDDGSTDGSLDIVRRFARSDGRLRIIPLARTSGPSVARNAGIEAARGRWLAVLDSDDMMHPDRLTALVAEAERAQAEICADNLLVFQDGARPDAFLRDPQMAPRWVTADEYVRSNNLFASQPALGYLKPLFDLAFVRKQAIRYNPALRIGEDYDFVLQLLARGARYRLTGTLGYFYRKHAHSTSHRMSAGNLEQMIAADTALRLTADGALVPLASALDDRRRSIERALAFTHIVSALKSRRWGQATKLALGHPGAAQLLRMPVAKRLGRLIARPAGPEYVATDAVEKRVCLISRQRIVGSTNGSSAYILSLCEALRARGYKVTLICPSPATLGRWPFLTFHSEMGVFDEVFIRGTWRIGRRLRVARDPKVFIAAGLAIAEAVLARIGLMAAGWTKPAPYAVAVPWTRDDQLYVANHAPRSSRAVIADYAFLASGIPFALCPRAHSLVVMHDLFSSRSGRFAAVKASDSVATINEADELALLSQGDAVVAIQAREARVVSERLPRTHVILAPMAVAATAEPQPGDDRTVLFVGSNTAPNVVGLLWFLDKVWPDLRRARPDCELVVAGTVDRSVSRAVCGVRFLGLVNDLDQFYRAAGVVISPLTVGSGLKIKLIEALGRGKAVVATSVTVEGVEDLVAPAVTVTDDASEFASAVAQLLEDRTLRTTRAQAALNVAQQKFSPAACHADLVAYIEQPILDEAGTTAGAGWLRAAVT